MSTAPEWSDAQQPGDMADALANILWALDQMHAALDQGRYNFDEVHVRADLTYLRAEARRARRQQASAQLADDAGVEFDPEQLTMLHRAVRQKLSRVRGDMARDRRRGQMDHARGKARSRYDYAALLLVLDALVPEDRR